MKKWIILLATVVSTVFTKAGSEIGMRVIPPSQRGYTVEAIRESGERGGLLIPVGTNFTHAHNKAMGDAMELWNAHRWGEAVSAFRRIWEQHPDSPWAAEAELHEACYHNFNGRFDEAEERFISVLRKYPDSLEIRKKVLYYLPYLYAQTERLQTALELLEELSKLPLDWQEEQYVENYQRIFIQALARENEDRLCGTKALAVALAAQNGGSAALDSVSIESVFNRYPWAKRKAGHGSVCQLSVGGD